MLKMHIFLIGMAGSGKTSLGRKLAQNLGVSFIDTDQKISDVFGLSVKDIFASFGEKAFRASETAVLAWLAGHDPCVVSTGGGLCTDPENVAIMKNLGIIIHIDRPLEQILSDIKLDRRPLLAAGGKDAVADLYNKRIGCYRAVADHRLDNSRGFGPGIKALTGIAEQYR